MAYEITMNQFEQVCRPVIFEDKREELYRYWGKGSSFLISNPENYYWVTASHVLKNTDGCVESVRIFPSDTSKISLPFDGEYTLKADSTNEEDYHDILILRINLQRFDDSGDALLIAQNLEQSIGAGHLREGDELWIIGYPSERTFFDYDNRATEHTRCVIRAIYNGKSSSEHHCHTLTTDTSLKLGSFDGLSGSPVFYKKSINRNGQSVDYHLLVGMLLRGTASSGIAHFVSVSVITEMVNLIESKIHHSVINRELKL